MQSLEVFPPLAAPAGELRGENQTGARTRRVGGIAGGAASMAVATLPALGALMRGVDIPKLAGEAAAVVRGFREDGEEEGSLSMLEKALEKVVLIHRVLRANVSWKKKGDEAEGEMCLICYNEAVDTTLKPCGHRVLCRVRSCVSGCVGVEATDGLLDVLRHDGAGSIAATLSGL